MKATLVTLAVLLVLFFQLVQIGETKKLQEQQQKESASSHKDIQQLRTYLELIESYSTVAQDPSRSGVAAALLVHHINKPLPPEQAIAYYEELLPSVKDDAVRRTIRFNLVELYTRQKKHDKALEQLRMVMTSEGAPTTRPSMAPLASERD